MGEWICLYQQEGHGGWREGKDIVTLPLLLFYFSEHGITARRWSERLELATDFRAAACRKRA